MAVSDDLVLIADPDTDRLHLVDLRLPEPVLLSTLRLTVGAEPGRVIPHLRGSFFVALRGGARVIHVSGDPLRIDATFDTCASPRGLSLGETSAELFVACLEGALLRLDAFTGEELARYQLDGDLRDVVVQGDAAWVSHFRSAAVTHLWLDDPVGSMRRIELSPSADGSNTAYRMIPLGGTEPNAEIAVLHQVSELDFADDVRDDYPEGVPADLFTTACNFPLVESALTIMRHGLVGETHRLGALTLPVDVAHQEGRFNIAAAGARAEGLLTWIEQAPAVSMIERADFGRYFIKPPCAPSHHVIYNDGRRATATVFADDGRTLVLTRSPTQLHIVEEGVFIDLPGPEVFDSGHDLFFGDATSGLACASCHPEGGDDGQVWHLAADQPRRTLDLRGGLSATAPYLWNGGVPTFEAMTTMPSGFLLSGVAHGRLARDLEHYVDALEVPEHGKELDPLAVDRGWAIFRAADQQCVYCHKGPNLTHVETFNVGTGGSFQPPSLVGVGLRGPYLHDGCAETLADVFGGPCAAPLHGRTSGLSEAQIADLVAYLSSL